MSKIICDICGTSYPETATQCPICGCVRSGDVQRVTNEVKSEGNVSTGYTYVKGGRFSKANVKKRNQGAVLSNAKPKEKENKDLKEKAPVKSNRGLVITAIVLLLAIIAVVIYIALRFFLPSSLLNDGIVPPKDTGAETGNLNDEFDDLACKGLTLDVSSVLFEQSGDTKALEVSVDPADTTDAIVYMSSDVNVATVSDDGVITAVGNGTAIITVRCGDVFVECQVVCVIPEDTSTEDTQETTEETTEVTETTESTETTAPEQDAFRLNRKDITFNTKGEKWILYSGSIAKNLITWSSSNERVATFENGTVVAVGSGTTEVHAEYDGQKISCIIRCNFKENAGVAGSGGGVSEDGGNSSSGTASGSCAIFTQYGGGAVTDITIKSGEKVGLILKDAAGNIIQVTWSVSGNGCSVSGNTITGSVSGSINKVSATYNGETYSCTIRVS